MKIILLWVFIFASIAIGKFEKIFLYTSIYLFNSLNLPFEINPIKFYVLATASADDFKCYDCNPYDTWCDDIEEVKNKADKAQVICFSEKCLVSGTELI